MICYIITVIYREMYSIFNFKFDIMSYNITLDKLVNLGQVYITNGIPVI